MYIFFLIISVALAAAEQEMTETFREGDTQELKAIFILKLSNSPGLNPGLIPGYGSPYNYPFYQGNHPFFGPQSGSPYYGQWGNYGSGLGEGFGPPTNFFGPPPGKVFGPPPGKVFGPPPGKVFGPPPGKVFGPPPGKVFGPPVNKFFGPPPGKTFGPPPGTYFGPFGQFPFWNNPGYSGFYPTNEE